MRGLWYVSPGKTEWRELPDPVLTSSEAALVRPLAVGTCDLDGWLIRGEIPIEEPFPLGHEFVAEVVEAGEAVASVRPGARVSVPFQISCGRCARCRAGQTGRCRSVPAGSAYGMGPLSDGLTWGGAIADLVSVPYADAMCVPLPDGLDSAALAGLSDNLVDGWRTVAPYLTEVSEPRVLIFGTGSIGLYATGVATALGAEVTYVDPDEDRCAVAAALGATVIQEPGTGRYESHPIVVHTTAQPDVLHTALRSTASSGICTDTGIYFGNAVELPLMDMYVKGVTFITGRCDARATMPAALALITDARLDPSLFVTQTAPWEEGADAWPSHRGRLVLAR